MIPDDIRLLPKDPCSSTRVLAREGKLNLDPLTTFLQITADFCFHTPNKPRSTTMATGYRTIPTEDGTYEEGEEHLAALPSSTEPLIGDDGDDGGKGPEDSDKVGLWIWLLTVSAGISGLLFGCVFNFVFVSLKLLFLVSLPGAVF